MDVERIVAGRLVNTVRGRQDRLFAAYAEDAVRKWKPDAWVLGPGRQSIRVQLGRLLLDDRVPWAIRIVVVSFAIEEMQRLRGRTKDAERWVRAVVRRRVRATEGEWPGEAPHPR